MEDIDDSVQMLAKCITFSTGHTKEVVLMVVTFNTLANLRTVNVGQDLQHFYLAKVRKNSLAKHPPRILNSFLRNFAFVNNLNTLSLLPTIRNCKPVLLV
jgi:hypothetical protein